MSDRLRIPITHDCSLGNGHRHQYRGSAADRAAKIPRAIYDYVERGSYDELTLKANRDELNAIRCGNAC